MAVTRAHQVMLCDLYVASHMKSKPVATPKEGRMKRKSERDVWIAVSGGGIHASKR